MTWDPVSERLWKVLEARPPKWGTYYASEVRGGAEGALLARDAVSGARHLFMRVESESDVHPDTQSRGVKLELRRLEGADGGVFADFWCVEPAKYKLFGVMVDEVLGRWASGEGSGPVIAGRVLQTWRSLLSAEGGTALSVPEQAGLFGELFFLELLSACHTHGVDCWHGPDGHPQDFVTGDWIAEVKSSLNHTSVFVHGAGQLDADPSNKLLLVVFQLALGPSGRSLAEQVKRVREQLGEVELERKLSKARFRDSDADRYAEIRFEVEQANVYEVGQRFPRITRRVLGEHCDESAIRDLQYEVLLAGLGPFEREPETLARFPKLDPKWR